MVGDLITRHGTDVHRVTEVHGDPKYAAEATTLGRVKAPAGGWCAVGVEESSLCRRYSWADLAEGSWVGGELLRGRVFESAD
ncbi:hypothetical protein ASF59_00115 [Methylobacterium sp. Leaf121]|nr:hypothetical protein ASF59_00115 [Methylobacterium sp. Leaf121]